MSSSSIRADTSRNSSSTDSLPSHPLLVSFPQGVPSDTDHLTVSVKAQTTKKGKYMKHVISVQQEDGGKSAGTNLYGYDFGDFSKERDTNQFAIVVYNEQTRKFKIHIADHVYALRSAPTEDAFNSSASDGIAAGNSKDSTLTAPERRKSLIEEFGSKKKKRALRAAASNTISVENISGAVALENALYSANTGDIDQELVDDATEALSKSATKRGKR